MWKNLGKGGIWFAIYFALQNITSAIFAFIYTIMNISNFPDATDFDAMFTFMMDVLFAVTVPSLITASLVMVLVYVLHRKRTKQALDVKSVDWKKLIFFAGIGCILNVTLNFILNSMLHVFPESWGAALEQSTGSVSTGQPFILLLLGTGILVPIMEEITFRYGLHRNIAKSNIVWAYIISAIAFGLIHGNPIQIMYAILIGVFLSFVYHKTNNLCYPIIIHMSINSASLCSMFFEKDLAFYLTIGGVGLGLLLVALMAKMCTNKCAKTL